MTVGTPANLDLEPLFLQCELGKLRAFHQFNDLLDLFEIQDFSGVEIFGTGG